MLKKVIKYTDYDDNEREETFYFNLSQAEVAEWETSVDGGMSKLLANIVATKDNKRIMELFKVIILKSYGEKSADGRRFVKSQELSEAFSQTEAFSNLFMELATNEAAASAFVNGIIPKGMTVQGTMEKKN